MTRDDFFGRMRSTTSVACVLLLLALGGPAAGVAQTQSASSAALDTALLDRVLSQDFTRESAPGAELPHKQRKVTRPLGELEPVVEWQWGAILATALAMTGAILLTLPVALAYKWTKPNHEYDPGVMHSSIILAPTIAGILIVIQGSLAMAFSLAGVATAVRFRNSLKDTNDAVYVFVAVAIGLAAGGQALDIALAISAIFSVMVLLLSKSPFRSTGNARYPANDHRRHHHHYRTEVPPGSHDHAGSPQAQSAEPTPYGSPWVEYITVRARHPEQARPAVETFLDRATKRWRLERSTQEADGAATLRYAVRCRKRTPRDQFLEEIRALARSQEFTVEAVSAPVPEPAAIPGSKDSPSRQ